MSNARVIAAAPEMLAVLVPIVDFLEKTGFASQEAKRARAAIRLAETGERA